MGAEREGKRTRGSILELSVGVGAGVGVVVVVVVVRREAAAALGFLGHERGEADRFERCEVRGPSRCRERREFSEGNENAYSLSRPRRSRNNPRGGKRERKRKDAAAAPARVFEPHRARLLVVVQVEDRARHLRARATGGRGTCSRGVVRDSRRPPRAARA